MNQIALIILFLAYNCPLTSGGPTDQAQILNDNQMTQTGSVSIFKNMYVLGDSFSDNGNFYKLNEYKEPHKDLYYQGRLSNGPVWVEYLSKMLKANLTNLAYAGATTDGDIYRAPFVPEKYYVPGCVQQVEQLKQNLPSDSQTNSSLVTVAFLGNDFFRFALPWNYIDNMKRCFDSLLQTDKFKHVMIVTSNAPELTPAARKVSYLLNLFSSQVSRAIPDAYEQLIPELRAKYPDTKFYQFDLARTMRGVANQKIPLPGKDAHRPLNLNSCLDSPKLALLTPQDTKICKDPSSHLFWDPLHPSTRLHEAIAIDAYKSLE